jgi:hypothetical protein
MIIGDSHNLPYACGAVLVIRKGDFPSAAGNRESDHDPNSSTELFKFLQVFLRISFRRLEK